MDEVIRKAIGAIHTGALVDCSADDYRNGLRTAMQEQAGKWIDGGDGLRAMITLQEVKRLDQLHQFNVLAGDNQ